MKIGKLIETFCAIPDSSLICQRCGHKYDPIFNCRNCLTITVWCNVEITHELRRRALQRHIAARHAFKISKQNVITAIRSNKVDSATAKSFSLQSRWDADRVRNTYKQLAGARDNHINSKRLVRV